MPSEVDLCNRALRALGSTKTIASRTERSEQARACDAAFDAVRGEVFRAFPWPFATTTGALALVEEFDGETLRAGEWAYSYRKPTGAIAFHRILSGARQDTLDTRIPFAIRYDADGDLILTDMEDAEGEWTFVEENTEVWPPDLCRAFAYLLAAEIAPAVTGGDPNRLGVRAMQLYLMAIGEAKASAANEEKRDPPADSEFIRARA